MKTIELVVFAVSTVAAMFYMNQLRNTVPEGERNEALLSRTEKVYVLLLVILSPLVSGAIFYFGWIKRLPGKARQANRWSITVAIVLVALYMALGGR